MSHIEPYGGRSALSIHESSHDTFDTDKNLNWLVNQAELGIFAHGRVHQQLDRLIYVGDMIHKRGGLTTDDVLLMEEQALDSMGEPLSAPSRLGALNALAILPTMNTANGEGDLIAYYQKGVVAFNTHESPRETRIDGDSITQRGWDSKRLINHLLNTVGAVGRYAVTVLTRDHFFRSIFGLHFLKVTLGDGTFNSENINVISQDVEPLLKLDEELGGAATGYWLKGNRMFATTGLTFDEYYSSSSYGRGFVSWNQAVTYSEDRTPGSAWEGLWLMDSGVVGIYNFTEEGFFCSDVDRNIYFGKYDKKLEYDIRDEKKIDILSEVTTGQFTPFGLDKRGNIQGGTFEATYSESSQIVQLWIRTDLKTEWVPWTTIQPCDKKKKITQRLRLMHDLTKPPFAYRECTWFQIKISSVGYFSDPLFSLDFSPTTVKSGRKSCVVIDEEGTDYFSLYNEHA